MAQRPEAGLWNEPGAAFRRKLRRLLPTPRSWDPRECLNGVAISLPPPRVSCRFAHFPLPSPLSTQPLLGPCVEIWPIRPGVGYPLGVGIQGSNVLPETALRPPTTERETKKALDSPSGVLRPISIQSLLSARWSVPVDPTRGSHTNGGHRPPVHTERVGDLLASHPPIGCPVPMFGIARATRGRPNGRYALVARRIRPVSSAFFRGSRHLSTSSRDLMVMILCP